METLISRADGREDGEEWTENYAQPPGGAGMAVHIRANERFVTEWLE